MTRTCVAVDCRDAGGDGAGEPADPRLGLAVQQTDRQAGARLLPAERADDVRRVVRRVVDEEHLDVLAVERLPASWRTSSRTLPPSLYVGTITVVSTSAPRDGSRSRGSRARAAVDLVTALRRALAEDLDTPSALALVDAWASSTGEDLTSPAQVVDAVDALLGVDLR